MRTLITLFVTASLLTYSFASFAVPQKDAESQSSENVQSDTRQLKHDVKTMTGDLEIIRRDQLNYKIEKDLLKEAYSSNLQSINLIITIVFGIFGVLGYLGLRSIKEIKLDYTNELNDLRSLKAKFEAELLQLQNNQKEFERRVGELAKTNEAQDRRLKILELTEKAGEFIKLKEWRWALQYISIGLEIDSENIMLLKQKAQCSGKLIQISSAAETWEKVLKLEPNNLSTITNLLEALAMSSQQNEFDQLYAANKDKVDQYKNGGLIIFLKVLLGLTKGDVENVVKELTSYAKRFPGETKEHLENWSFDEVSGFASKMLTGKPRNLLLKTVQYFGGKIPTEVFVKYLVELK